MSNLAPAERTPASAGAGVADGLARPISFASRYGAGAERALVLGGGGIYFVAWQIAYLKGLSQSPIDNTHTLCYT